MQTNQHFLYELKYFHIGQEKSYIISSSLIAPLSWKCKYYRKFAISQAKHGFQILLRKYFQFTFEDQLIILVQLFILIVAMFLAEPMISLSWMKWTVWIQWGIMSIAYILEN